MFSSEIARPRGEGREIASPRSYSGQWEVVHYEDRDPRKGKRADAYHAQRLFPNYYQFSRTRTGPTMTDAQGREYQVADGVDRQEDFLHGRVSFVSPYEVLPMLYTDPVSGQTSIHFPGVDQVATPIDFVHVPRKKQILLRKRGERVLGTKKVVRSEATYAVSRGTQLLYVRIPRDQRKANPELTLPNVGDRLDFYHYGTELVASGVVEEVDGFQFPRTATGSVRVRDLTFFVSPSTL